MMFEGVLRACTYKIGILYVQIRDFVRTKFMICVPDMCTGAVRTYSPSPGNFFELRERERERENFCTYGSGTQPRYTKMIFWVHNFGGDGFGTE
jgi:hypothetical protein